MRNRPRTTPVGGHSVALWESRYGGQSRAQDPAISGSNLGRLQLGACNQRRCSVLMTVGASIAARFGACAEGFVHDLFDRPGAAAALGAATQAAVNLPGGTRKIGRGGHGVADVMVAQDIARTDNHEGKQLCSLNPPIDRKDPAKTQKEKAQFQCIPNWAGSPVAGLNPGSSRCDQTVRTQGNSGLFRSLMMLQCKIGFANDHGEIRRGRSLIVQTMYETLARQISLFTVERFRGKVKP